MAEHGVGRRERIAVAAYVILAAAGLTAWAIAIHGATPVIRDEMAYLWHAGQIAGGHITAPVPKHADSFEIPPILAHDDRRFSRYPLGYPLALAPWVPIGAPWALNVALGAASLLLLFDLVRRTEGPAAAWLSLALLSLSPFFIAGSTTFLPHPLLLFLTLAFFQSLVRWEAAPMRRRWPFVAGAAIAYALNVSPFAAAAMGLVAVGFWCEGRAHQRPRTHLWATGFLPPLLVGGVAFALANRATTGSYFVPAYYLEPYVRAGFGREIGLGGYGPLDAVVNTKDRLVLLDEMLFGWPIPSLVFVAIFAGARVAGRTRGMRWDRALVILGIATIGLYALWYHPGTKEGTGPRYLYPLLPALVIFSARGLLIMAGAARWLAERGPRPVARRATRAVFRAFPAASLFLLLAAGTIPYLFRMAASEKARDRRGVRDFLAGIELRDIRRGTVLVDPRSGALGAALLHASDFGADRDLVFAWDLGPLENRPLLRSRGPLPIYRAEWSPKDRQWRLSEHSGATE